MLIGDVFRRAIALLERGDGLHTLPWQQWSSVAADSPDVSVEEARALPGVGRGVEFVASVLSQLNPQAHRWVDGADVRVSPTPVLWADPAPGWHPLPVWLATVADDLQWHGNAFLRIGFDRAGHRMSLLPVPAAGMVFDGGYRFRDASGTEVEVPSHEVVHIAANVRAGHRMGAGIIANYQHALKLIRATESAQFVAMRSGVPVGVITVEGSPTITQMQAYKAALLESQRERSVAVMANAKFQAVNWSPAELGLIPAREFNLRLAADVTGVPPYLLGVPAESRVYSNQETEWTNFLRGGFGRIVATVEAALSRVKAGDTIRFDIDELLRPDSSARWANHQIAVGIGAMTVDEVRTVERLGPMPMPVAEVVVEEEEQP